MEYLLKWCVFFLTLIFSLSLVNALNNDISVSCGGNKDITVGCLGNQDLIFLGNQVSFPIVTIISPIAFQTYTNNYISISVVNNKAGYCEYNINQEERRAMTNSSPIFTDIYFTNNIGTFTINAYCNDSLGNEGNSSLVFFKRRAGSDTGDTGGGDVAVIENITADNYTFYLELNNGSECVFNSKCYVGIYIFKKSLSNRIYINPDFINVSIEGLEAKLVALDNPTVGYYLQSFYVDIPSDNFTEGSVNVTFKVIKNDTVKFISSFYSFKKPTILTYVKDAIENNQAYYYAIIFGCIIIIAIVVIAILFFLRPKKINK